MNWLDRFHSFTLKELLFQVLAKISNRNFRGRFYAENLLPYAKSVNGLLSRGYKVRRLNDKMIEISVNSNRYFIRRYGSDSKVFEQVVVNEEYGQLLKLVDLLGLRNVPLTILDCGSNIGLFSLWMMSQVNVKKIVSVEADPDNYTFQKQILGMMPYENKIELINRAIWSDSASSMEISTSFRDGQHWAKSVVLGSTTSQVQVKSISLNQVLEDYLDQEIHILKIDIEGAEKSVFEKKSSFDRMLDKARIIAIEIHKEVESNDLILDVLRSNGFLLEEFGETTFGYKK